MKYKSYLVWLAFIINAIIVTLLPILFGEVWVGPVCFVSSSILFFILRNTKELDGTICYDNDNAAISTSLNNSAIDKITNEKGYVTLVVTKSKWEFKE